MVKKRMTRRGYIPRPMDARTAAEGFSFPGMDPRQWISYGRVSSDDGEDIVVFDEDEGQPLVQVSLEPSRTTVFCRISTMTAGNGEGDYFPFVNGDEVLVAIPEGSERAGCVIIGRLNNAIDKFPMESVAGQDPTTNTFAFSRRRTPFVQEFAGPITLRNSETNSLISLDNTGNVTIRDTNGSALQISADAVSLMGQEEEGAEPEFIMQMNMTDGNVTLQARDGILNLSAGGPGSVTVNGTWTMQNSGNAAIEHVTTTEQVANVITQVYMSFAIFLAAATPIVPFDEIALVSHINAFLIAPDFATAWNLAAIKPLAVPNALLPLAITGAIVSQIPKIPSPIGQPFPGVACAGTISG